MQWLILTYDPISTFELRPSNTTKTGGKTLLVPTPYAIKMAFLDRIIRHNGVTFGREIFPQIRDLQVAMQPPHAQAINRTFQKILRPAKGNAWNETIAMREFCVQSGTLTLALGSEAVANDAFQGLLERTASAINYFGQRGSFFQLTETTRSTENITENGFVDASQATKNMGMGFLQRMDDMQPDATFENISTFQKGANGARQSYTVIFPYRIADHGHNHTIWEVQS